MKQSALFTTTKREAPREETSVNARLLEQAGYVDKLMAGVYSYLPLGFRSLKKVEQIIREEMNAVGGQEMLMPALQPKELWDKTGRWEGLREVMYQFKDHAKHDVGLGVTHEEVVAKLARQYVASYKDLPKYVYQIQTKYRFELRPKSGLNRGREFPMKDLYSLHASIEDLDTYYEKVKESYLKIFERCGLDAKVVEASGGDFTDEFTHEFQVYTDAGEDHVLYCAGCSFAQNREIAKVKEGDRCPQCDEHDVQTTRGIEVGNIFKLGTMYSEGIGAYFVDTAGKRQPIIMASYGIGLSRILGTVVEIHHDQKGITWPASISPYDVHLVSIDRGGKVRDAAEKWYEIIQAAGASVLFDDRKDVSPGEKFNDADLIGIPIRLVVSARTEEQNGIEWKLREEQDGSTVSASEAVTRLKAIHDHAW